MPSLGQVGKEFTEEKIRRLYTEAEKQIRVLVKFGWCVPMLGDFSVIQDAAEAKDEEGVDEYFLSFYSDDKHQALQVLKGSMLSEMGLLHWKDVIDQAFSAYENSLYLIVVPALLAVVEGAVVENVNARHKALNVKNSMGKLRKSSPSESYRRLFIKSLETVMMELFKPVPFSSNEPPRLNRNLVLHGRNMHEAKQADCLRLFQLVHALGICIQNEEAA